MLVIDKPLITSKLKNSNGGKTTFLNDGISVSELCIVKDIPIRQTEIKRKRVSVKSQRAVKY